MCGNGVRPPLLLFGGLLLFAAGCGSGKYPVAGRVLYSDGSPVQSGYVRFESVDTEKPFSARGYIREDGTFRLEDYKEGNGAFEGHYRIAIQRASPPPARLEKKVAPPSPIMQRFTSFDTSGLEYTVKPGANEVNLTVEKPSPAAKRP